MLFIIYRQTLLRFDSQELKKIRHPGGIQVANGIIAAGLEEYGFMGVSTKEQGSQLCFYDANSLKEYANLRTPIDKDRASAVAIIYYKDCWLVAVRGNKQSVQFYYFRSNNQIVGSDGIPEMEKFESLGEFQNLNFLTDEKGDLYMIGMESTKKLFGTGVKTNYCWLYKIECNLEIENEKITRLAAVWIDKETGRLCESDDYKQAKEYRIKFITNFPASFQWSSCVYMEGSDGAKTIGDADRGFTGKLKVYASSDNVEDWRDDIYPGGDIVLPCNIFNE